MPETVRIDALGGAIEDAVVARIEASQPHELLVLQAQRRMEAGGDSEHTYPDLWDPPFPSRRRKGDKPLLDTGRLSRALSGRTEVSADGGTISSTLTSLLYGAYHQSGFETEGPNFIPLTNKALFHVTGANPVDEGLVRGVDFIMAWQGVKVPQRKIFNMPAEDREEIRETMEVVAGG